MLTYQSCIKEKIKFIVAILSFIIVGTKTYSQTYISGPVTAPLAAGSYYNNNEITLNPGFSFTASSGQSLQLSIIVSDCVPLVTAPSTNQNYIMVSSPRTGGITTSTGFANRSTCDLMQSIQYFDGLGRPLQTVQVKGSPAGNDIVQPIAYDQYGREVTQYLPYANNPALSSDGSYKADAISAQQPNFYNSSATWAANIATTSYPTTGINFEASPLNRKIEQGAPGQNWQLSASGVLNSGHTVKMVYGTNVANEVLLWSVNSTGTGATGGGTYYTAGMLHTTTTTDENNNNTIEYKDFQGRVVCKKVQSGSNPVTYIATYYIYNSLNNLTYVIPPLPAGTAYPASFLESDPIFTNFIYGYHYDNRNRLVEKKIPGKTAWDYIVYNTLDQVVATQDPNQRANNQWIFTKYDGQGRVIQTGIWNNGNVAISRPNLVTQVNMISSFWETRASGSDYTTNAWPTSWLTTLAVSYYDNYNFPGRPYGSTVTGVSSNVTGLVTGTKTTILNPDGTFGSVLWSVNYYDDHSRLVETSQQHYLGGSANYSASNYDDITTSYDFLNQVTGTIRHHYTTANLSTAALTSAISYYYDHMGRKTQTWQAVYTGSSTTSAILLSQTDYNELGQAKTKHLHSGTGSAPFLQDIAYAYNERGWLTQINDPSVAPTATKLFGLKLNYNSPQFGGAAQFNGNIAEEQYYASLGGNQHVVYAYDNLNRLTSGTSSIGYSETGISYDNLGNISALTRSGPNGAVLVYNYTGNQLQTVTNSGSTFRSYGYDASGNAASDGMGNTINYNLLNLPRSIPGKGLTYTYTATGEKLKKIVNGATTDYISGIQYKTDGTIDFIMTDEGRAIKSGTSFNFEYTLTDQLGNNRVTFDQTTGKTGEDDYYPFGLNVHKLVNGTNNYLYNRKEMQPELNNQYDYGARFYDPVIARWTRIDNKVEAFENISPYVYAVNDPVNAIDPDGNLIIFVNGFVPGQWLMQNNEKYEHGQTTMPNLAYRPYPGDRNFHRNFPSYLGKSFDYWGKVDDAFMGKTGFNDHNALYVNASSQNDSEAADRFAEGVSAGKNLMAQLEAGTISLADGETIKIVSHSQGGAFAAGMADVLSKSKKYASVLRQVVYLEPHEPADFAHPSNIDATQISSPDDKVASIWNFLSFLKGKTSYSKIKGVNHFIPNKTHKGDKLGGHSVETNLDEIAEYFRSLGIPVTVKD